MSHPSRKPNPEQLGATAIPGVCKYRYGKPMAFQGRKGLIHGGVRHFDAITCQVAEGGYISLHSAHIVHVCVPASS